LALHEPRGKEQSELETWVKDGAAAFTIGICATGSPGTLAELIDVIESERFPPGFVLEKVVIVASAVDRATLERLEKVERTNLKVTLVHEEQREGKAAAVNTIIGASTGRYLVLVNADALPSPSSISRLLRSIGHDPATGAVSGVPMIAARSGIASRILKLMWDTHNTCSQELNPSELGNHGTDELMVVRLDAINELPAEVVNDGAYIAGKLRVNGFRVRSLEGATVYVDVPTRPVDIIRQRRRILYGHLQVWRMVGKVPAVTESLMLLSPDIGFGAMVRTISDHPKLILALPFAAVCEFISLVGAISDTNSKRRRHVVWKRYADR
jgi:cellulose synthase/poly-beta-1,6-N-acetylglucosamine synthase-like glycosyltransferase